MESKLIDFRNMTSQTNKYSLRTQITYDGKAEVDVLIDSRSWTNTFRNEDSMAHTNSVKMYQKTVRVENHREEDDLGQPATNRLQKKPKEQNQNGMFFCHYIVIVDDLNSSAA